VSAGIATNAIAIQLFPKTGVASRTRSLAVRMSPKWPQLLLRLRDGGRRALFRSGFRLEAMSTDPPFRQLACGGDLPGVICDESLRFEICSSRRLVHRDRRPDVGSRQIGGDAATSPITRPQRALRATLPCSAASWNHCHRLRVIVRDTFSVVISARHLPLRVRRPPPRQAFATPAAPSASELRSAVPG